MLSPMRRTTSGLLLFMLVLTLITLLPLAYAEPPDPVWVTGFFDDGDSDEAVFLITSSLATVDPFPLDDSPPVPLHEPAPVGDDAKPLASPCVSTADARASPLS